MASHTSSTQNNTMTAAAKKAIKILGKYFICNHCLGRLFARQLHLTLHAQLGQKLRKDALGDLHNNNNIIHSNTVIPKCYICKGLFDSIPHILQLMHDASAKYEFASFAVGAIIKLSIMDRDDHIRSAYKLQGADSVKTGLTRELGRQFAKSTNSKHNTQEPEITLTVQPAENYCEVLSKPVVMFGRYTKHARGISQKQDACTSCIGKGCYMCEFHGLSDYNSVEGQISKFLFGILGGTTARFTWIGGEDRDSLVHGCGRPFFVRIQSPKKRHIATPQYNTKIQLESIRVNFLNNVNVSDVKPVAFSSRVIIHVEMTSAPYDNDADSDRHVSHATNENTIGNKMTNYNTVGEKLNICTCDDDNSSSKNTTNKHTCKDNTCKVDKSVQHKISKPAVLRRLKRLIGSSIEVRTKNDHIVKKTIASLKYRRDTSTTNSVIVWATLDGGIPIKRFVTGDGVWPSISQTLGASCKCTQFDFEDVILQRGLHDNFT